jgi:hypothetical protein
MQQIPQINDYNIVPDENYSFDYAVYPKATEQTPHSHSIALIKYVKD